MRIALVGPTYPFKGGVAAHTTQTALHLAAAGHDVDLVSWSRLYPKRLYPGEQTLSQAGPDTAMFEPTTRPLRWDRPVSWWRTGSRLRGHDLVVLVAVVPAQVPALLALACSARRGRVGLVVLAHNVVPHETHPGGRWLMRGLLRAADGVLVHTEEQARLARGHGAGRVVVAGLPPHLPGEPPSAAQRALAVGARVHRLRDATRIRVLSLGFVREYKGVDLLLTAARSLPQVLVTVAGEQWGQAGRRVRELAEHPDLRGRVRLRPEYVPAAELTALMAEHDLFALPYRHATASQNVEWAHAHGLPVLATAVGTFAETVRDGVDGVLVAPGDDGALVAGLTAALGRLAQPGVLADLALAVPPVDLEAPWQGYVEALVTLGKDAARARGRVGGEET